MTEDRLHDMFEMRKVFMRSLADAVPDSGPAEWPLDLSQKKNQRICRDVALRGVEEIFEAVQNLKGWKPHRVSDVSDFDRDKFLEEIVDAMNYFFSLLILAGYSEDDLHAAYIMKDKIITDRLTNGY